MKEQIIDKLEGLTYDLEEYLKEWKKTGGGTRGHAIGSMIEGIRKKTKFFKDYC